MLRRAGWTKRDMDHARLLASLPEEAIPAIVKASVKASERESRAAVRRYAQAFLEQLEQMDMAEETADHSDVRVGAIDLQARPVPDGRIVSQPITGVDQSGLNEE
jgi:hypothetical protein